MISYFELYTLIDKQKNRVIPIFYLVGCIGFMFPSSSIYFSYLTPFLLIYVLISLLVQERILQYRTIERKWIILLSIFYILTFSIEAIGVNTGAVFGQYQYGAGLGIKVFNTPVMIGINWIIVFLGSVAVVDHLLKYKYIGLPIVIVLGGVVMVFMDTLIEPVAPMMHMWRWEKGVIPMQNYVSWFTLSVVMHLIYRLGKFTIDGKLSTRCYVTQILFFLVLNLVYHV